MAKIGSHLLEDIAMAYSCKKPGYYFVIGPTLAEDYWSHLIPSNKKQIPKEYEIKGIVYITKGNQNKWYHKFWQGMKKLYLMMKINGFGGTLKYGFSRLFGKRNPNITYIPEFTISGEKISQSDLETILETSSENVQNEIINDYRAYDLIPKTQENNYKNLRFAKKYPYNSREEYYQSLFGKVKPEVTINKENYKKSELSDYEASLLEGIHYFAKSYKKGTFVKMGYRIDHVVLVFTYLYHEYKANEKPTLNGFVEKFKAVLNDRSLFYKMLGNSYAEMSRISESDEMKLIKEVLNLPVKSSEKVDKEEVDKIKLKNFVVALENLKNKLGKNYKKYLDSVKRTTEEMLKSEEEAEKATAERLKHLREKMKEFAPGLFRSNEREEKKEPQSAAA